MIIQNKNSVEKLINKKVGEIMKFKKDEYIKLYFEQKRSFLVTEIMSIYTATEDLEIKIKCLELLNKIEG